MRYSFEPFIEKLPEFIHLSRDGYALFSPRDVLLCCNPAFAEQFNLADSEITGSLTFDEMIRGAFHTKKGPKLDTDNIELWLEKARKLRRTQGFRLFEVDLMDGRWFLFSEQLLPSGEILVQTKEMTRQKVLEQNLNQHTQHLTNLALTDELTQLSNRRSFIASVQSEISRCLRQNSAVALLLLDIDHFKTVNDSFGHQAGDEVLCQIARLIKSTLRKYDICGRIGGEEFGIFLAETNRGAAVEIAERLRQQIADEKIYINHTLLPVTVSIGIALSIQDTRFEQLYSDADAALYRAKNSGRNRVIVADFCVIL